MLNIGDIAITSLDVITAFDAQGNYRFTLDELQNATIANSQETQDITGKGGRLLNTLKRNKSVTVSGTNGLISGGLLEAQTGSEFEQNGTAMIEWSETLTIEDDAAATSYVAVGAEGAEIEALYIKNASGVASEKLVQAAAAAEGKFAYDPATKALSFNADDYADGTEIVVFYARSVSGYVVANDSEKFSEKMRLIIDATAEDKCNNIYRVQIEIPRADFSGEFSLEFGDNQAVHAFEARSVITAGCGKTTGGILWTYTIFGADAEDTSEDDSTDDNNGGGGGGGGGD